MARSFGERWRTGKSIARFCSIQIGNDPKLLVFPLTAGIVIVLIFFIYFAGLFMLPDPEQVPEWVPILLIILLAVVYLITYFIRVYFEAAMVAYVHERMERGRSSVGHGLSRAASRAGKLFKWAILSAIVGVISDAISSIGSKNEGSSKITNEDGKETEFTSLQGVWSMATYFVLPMILYEDTRFWKLPVRSARLVTEFWGEVMVGRLAVGIIFALLLLPAIIIFVVGLILESASGYIIAIICAGYIISIASVRGVSGGVLSVTMYRYTQTGKFNLAVPEWVHPTDVPISRGQTKVDQDFEVGQKREKEKEKEKVARAISEEGKFEYYGKRVMGYSFAAMFLGGIANLIFGGTIMTSLVLWGVAAVIVVIGYAVGWVKTAESSSAEIPKTMAMAVQGFSRPEVGDRVMVTNPDGDQEFAMVTGMEHGMVTVRLNDGSYRKYAESDCMKL